MACLVLIGAEPTTKPAEDFSDVKSILADAPADIVPKSGERWTQVNADLLKKWCVDKYGGKVKYSASLTGEIKQVDVKSKRLKIEVDNFRVFGREFKLNEVSAFVAEPELHRFATLKSSQKIRVIGQISNVSPKIGIKEQTFSSAVTLRNAEFQIVGR